MKKIQLSYLSNARLCLACRNTGELINITNIFNDFERPIYHSPRRHLIKNVYKDLISEEIQKSNFEIEKVIRYQGRDIYVNATIALTYMSDLCLKYDDYLFRLTSVTRLSNKRLKELLNRATGFNAGDIENLPF